MKETNRINAALQELLKEYIQSQHFTSTADIMAAMEEMFRDVIQTVMEAEMDEELGRQRCERSEAAEGEPRNYPTAIPKRRSRHSSEKWTLATAKNAVQNKENDLRFAKKIKNSAG